MSSSNEAPLYNIGIVARLTSIPVSTLRMWERRYQFPASARTAGGQRLYSEHEIARLRWVKAQIEGGLQVSHAIRALQHLEAEGRLPELQPGLAASQEARPRAGEVSLDALRARLQAALLAHDFSLADQVFSEAVTLYAPEQLIEAMVHPVLDELGRGWQAGQVSIATEHFATNYLRHRLVLWMLTGPPVFAVRPVVLACAPGELHEGSLMMLGVLLRRRRWPVVYLGQSLPLAELAAVVRDIRPLAVVVVAMTAESAAALADWPAWLPQAAQTGTPLLGFGGHIFTIQPEWCQRITGLYLGATVAEGLERLERWLLDRAKPPLGEVPGAG